MALYPDVSPSAPSSRDDIARSIALRQLMQQQGPDPAEQDPVVEAMMRRLGVGPYAYNSLEDRGSYDPAIGDTMDTGRSSINPLSQDAREGPAPGQGRSQGIFDPGTFAPSTGPLTGMPGMPGWGTTPSGRTQSQYGASTFAPPGSTMVPTTSILPEAPPSSLPNVPPGMIIPSSAPILPAGRFNPMTTTRFTPTEDVPEDVPEDTPEPPAGARITVHPGRYTYPNAPPPPNTPPPGAPPGGGDPGTSAPGGFGGFGGGIDMSATGGYEGSASVGNTTGAAGFTSPGGGSGFGNVGGSQGSYGSYAGSATTGFSAPSGGFTGFGATGGYDPGASAVGGFGGFGGLGGSEGSGGGAGGSGAGGAQGSGPDPGGSPGGVG